MANDAVSEFQKNLQEAKGAVPDLYAKVDQALDRIRPAVQADGGNVEIVNIDAEKGVLYLQMQGACGGCPSSRMTLRAGIERIVREMVPEIQRVEAV
jgi:Fe-S cluster biogenesis protein NfuA